MDRMQQAKLLLLAVLASALGLLFGLWLAAQYHPRRPPPSVSAATRSVALTKG